jgi:hypothetical protein
MTRQHYKALAQEIRLIRVMESREAAFRAVATACELFNPRFDRRIFAAACQVSSYL